MGDGTEKSAKIRNIAKACLFACCLFAATGACAEEAGGAPAAKPSAASLQKIYADLQTAIQSRDYRVLLQEPAEQRLRWKDGDAAPRDIAVRDLLGRLHSAASPTKISVLQKPFERAGLVTIGTEGWPGDQPYRMFQFKIIGRNSLRWKWVGCSAAAKDETGGEGLLGADEARLLPGLLQDMEKAAAGNDFTVLKKYVPDGTLLFNAPCGPGGPEPREWDLDETADMLLQASGQGEITFNPYPDVHAWGGAERTYVSIDTEGWTSEYPFQTFTFSRDRDDARWRWEGVCYDVLPPLRDEANGERNYFSRPLLPRPGPRRFSDVSALRSRISEIVAFGEWDALKAYAPAGTLIFGECSREMLEADKALGKAFPVDQVISFLKDRSPDDQPVRETRISHATFYETGGWLGKYPYVLFWFSEDQGGWQFSAVTYCRQKQFDVPEQDETFLMRMLKKVFP